MDRSWVLSRRAIRVFAAFALFLITPAAIHAQEEPAADPSADAEVRSVVEEFHAALAAGDSTRALEYLHPDVVVYEAGHAESLAQYRSGHLASDIAFSGAVTFQTVRGWVVPGRELSIYLREYTMTGTFQDREIDAHGTETIVLVSTEEGWKIRHIHWSSR
jgi:ketosteroid isomerase-like protein